MENILVNIDSRFRNKKLYPNSGSYTYTLDEPIKNVSYVRVSSVELPNMYYLFLNKYNNTTFEIHTASSQYTVQIQEGNYTSDLFISNIQSQLDAIATANGGLTSFVISWDQINYRTTISNNQPFSLVFGNGSPNTPYDTLGYHLGFKYNDTEYTIDKQQSQVVNGATKYYWTSNSFLNTTKDEYLFLRINNYGNIINEVRDKNLIAKILLFDTQYIIDNGSNFLTKMHKFKQPEKIHKFEIELISPRGLTIDMNDIEFSMTLEIGTIYDAREYEKYDFNLMK
jgi:hypothetical protein